jgi:methyl-accepting chemotaxis protein-1 (serine sensor receptor)
MFSTMTIRQRLIATLALLGLVLALVGAAGVYGMRAVNGSLKDVYSNELASVVQISESQILLARARFTLDRVMVHPDDAKVAETLTRAQGFLDASAKAWQSYLALPQSAEEKKLSDAMDKKRTAYINDGLLALSASLRAGDTEQADKMFMKGLTPLFGAAHEAAEALNKYQSDTARAQYEQSQSLYMTQLTLTIGGVVGAVLLILVSSVFLLRAIFGPLNQALAHFTAIADGNLSNHIAIARHDEMGALLTGLEKMQARLADTVRSVRDGSGAIATASQEIATGNLDLSRRTEQQASSLEETASSLEELTATVKQNADHARTANQLAASASDVAVKGGELVARVVETMGAISGSSKKIADIIGVIDGIAFQTNILALNAAVEAARAGEQGRGFAVVASEVRNLAQRSAAAAKDIKQLIDASVKNVADGGSLVGEAGGTMGDIVASIGRVTDIMNEISAAGHEQEIGIGQINQAVAEMDAVTQQNAALVEQAAAAAQAMQDQSVALAEMVSVFTLDAGGAGASARRARAPVAMLAR